MRERAKAPQRKADGAKKSLPLKEGFNRRWARYAAAAAAAGAICLTSTPAGADIISAPSWNDDAYQYGIDINLSRYFATAGGSFSGRQSLWAEAYYHQGSGVVAPLNTGAKVSSKEAFASRLLLAGRFSQGSRRSTQRVYSFNICGPKPDCYLGFEFSNSGHEDYGWVELSDGGAPFPLTPGAFAYDNTGAPIDAGQTSDTPEPGTLGLLALGSLGLAFWRRRKAVDSQQ